MPPEGLERTIGELGGQLRMLVPTLERFEVRQLEAEKAAARAESELQQVRKEVDDHHKKSSRNFEELFEQGRALEKVDADLASRIGRVETGLEEEKKKRAGVWKKVWDVLQIVLAAAGGAAMTKLMG